MELRIRHGRDGNYKWSSTNSGTFVKGLKQIIGLRKGEDEGG
jgi:hypothetical protein